MFAACSIFYARMFLRTEEILLCWKPSDSRALMGLGGKGQLPSIPTWPLSKQEKYTFVCLVFWLLYRAVKLGCREEGKMNGEEGISLSSLCKWSACRMYIEMPYKTKPTHKWSGLGPFHSSHTVKHKTQNWVGRAYLLN